MPNKSVLEQIIEHPKLLSWYSPRRLRDELMAAGYEVKPLSKGHYKGINFEDGGGYKVNFGGNGIIAYHPEEKSHHKTAYYKISNGLRGTKRYDLGGKEIFE